MFEAIRSVFPAGFIFYCWLVIACAAYGIFNFTSQSKSYKVLTVILIIVFISEIIGRVTTITLGYSYPAYHILILILIAGHTYMYLQLYPYHKILHWVIITLAVLLTTVSIILSIYVQAFNTFPSYSLMLLSLWIVCYALLQYYYMLINPTEENLFKLAVFWFNSGNFIFYSLTFFIFGFFNVLIKSGLMLTSWIYDFIWLANIILYSCYFVALRLDSKAVIKF